MLLITIFGIAFGIALYKSYKEKKAKEANEMRAMINTEPPCFTVIKTNLVSERAYTGLIKAEKDITIGAAVNGEIKNIFVDIGSLVTQGEHLIEIDKRYKEIDLNKAKAEVLESTVALSNATIDLENNKKLWKQKVIGDDILRQYIVKHRNCLAECERDNAYYNYTMEQLRDCTIIAPCDGNISKRYVDVGERVNVNQPLLDMVYESILRVMFFVEDRDVVKIKPGGKIFFYNDIYPDNVFTASIKYISSNVEPKMRLYRVEAEYINNNLSLKPGMIVKLKVPIRAFKDSIVIPSSTIDHYGNGDYVILYQGKSNVETRVKTGWEYKGWTQITEGLNPGDKIILK